MAATQINLPLVGASPYWGDPVASAVMLPASGSLGEVRLTLDTGNLYYWDGAAWQSLPLNGDVFGPASSTDDALARWDGITGKLLKDSVATLSDAGALGGLTDLDTDAATIGTDTGPARLNNGTVETGPTDLETEVTGVLPIANGGTNANAFTANRIVAANAGGTALTPTAYTESTITDILADITSIEADISAIEADIVTIEADIVDLQNDKVDKVAMTANALVRADGTGGDIKGSDAILDESENLTGLQSITLSGTASFFKLAPLTEVQRNALTPAAGMIVFNNDTSRFEGYFDGGSGLAWGPLHGWGS